ncbi:hypothetical protein ABZV58_28405 [Nocardia sp. NPDC004654]|uniref:hypothetical protein n=1 Tax=Nocardia sp. NPDC004654 TaxID=3154776 RepID=UPI0033A55063
MASTASDYRPPPTPTPTIARYEELVATAYRHGKKIWLGTVLPATTRSPAGGIATDAE